MVMRIASLIGAATVFVFVSSGVFADDGKTNINANNNANSNALEKQAGDVKSVCSNDPKSGHLICALVYAKQPYFGIQFGSEDDPESVAVTAGARRAENSKIEIRIDHNVSHFIYGDGFLGKEAEAIVDEIKKGKRIYVRVDPYDNEIKSEDTVDLSEFKSALQEIEDLRKDPPYRGLS